MAYGGLTYDVHKCIIDENFTKVKKFKKEQNKSQRSEKVCQKKKRGF